MFRKYPNRIKLPFQAQTRRIASAFSRIREHFPIQLRIDSRKWHSILIHVKEENLVFKNWVLDPVEIGERSGHLSSVSKEEQSLSIPFKFHINLGCWLRTESATQL